MNNEQLTSSISASAVENSSTAGTAQIGTRPSSATSTATERPMLTHPEVRTYPSKPPSVDSNFSSVQGKTAGSSPDHEDARDIDDTISSIWDESVQDKTPPARPRPVEAAVSTSSNSASEQPRAPSSHRPDWMTDDLDESWPEEEVPAQSVPTQSNGTTQVDNHNSTPHLIEPPIEPAASQDVLATPSAASRKPLAAASSSALPNPAFSAARHQARRALLKGRPSGAGAPTPRSLAVNSAFQAGPSTPSLRLPSHQTRRERVRSSNAENQEGDSTIWSESESDSASDSPSNDSAPDDFESARGSLAENSRITNMQTAQQTRAMSQRQGQSPTLGSDASGAKGTFIHRADASSLPPILRPVWQSPAKGQNKKGITALGGDMFTPMRLQTMFKTPTPPEQPMQNIMSVVTPFTIPAEPASDTTRGQVGIHRQDASPSADDREHGLQRTTTVMPSDDAAPSRPIMTIGLPSTPFTFQSPHTTMQDRLQPSRGMIPSKSMHNMQTLHPNGLQATALARPASAAADLGLPSGPPTPHTPMRLFKFDYDDAATRARLEDMVSERTPSAAPQPPRAADVERERKRLRLDLKPRKVMTGDLMSMPVPGSSEVKEVAVELAQAQRSASMQPVVDYVKESAGFMSALQHAVRIQSGRETSPEWATEEEGSSGNAGESAQEPSFHHGRVATSPAASASPPRRRRFNGLGHRRQTSQPQQAAAREGGIQSVVEQASPERLSSRRLPPDSSFITESSSNDVPMSSTLKSRASLSRQIAALANDGESPRKLLRRISAAAIAEDEVAQEFEGPESQQGQAWEPVKLAEEAIAHRDEQIRQLEERIARRRQLYTPAKADNAAEQTRSLHVPLAVQRPQLITLHEPTLEAIAAQRRSNATHASEDESDFDDSSMADGHGAPQDAPTRRFQDGIVLYDSERIPNPPVPEPSRVLRNIASAAELRKNALEVPPARASSSLALPTQPLVASKEQIEHTGRRGDRTASSNTLVDRSGGRTVSGDIGPQLTVSDLDGKGATITRTGSLFNISQIPEQEIESLGRGKLTFNKDLHRWEKVARSRSSQEDLRSAASLRNDVIEGMPKSKTPIPPIPEASVEISRSQDVFSESVEEQQARTQLGARTNSFQQRLDSLSSTNVSAVDARLSDSSDPSDPFRDFESFGQSSHAPTSASNAVNEDDESTPRPRESHIFVSTRECRNGTGTIQNSTPQDLPAARSVPSRTTSAQSESLPSTIPSAASNNARTSSTPPSGLIPRTLPTSTVPRSSSSLRNVVTYSPDSTVSSRHSGLEHATNDRGRHHLREDRAENAGTKRSRENANENANVYATPDRRSAREQFGTPTPRASVSSISTPKSILKPPAAFRSDEAGRQSGSSHNMSGTSAAGGGTPNRTISFADPPSATRARDLGLTLPSRAKGAGQSVQSTLGHDAVGGGEEGRTQAISSALKMLADLTLGDESTALTPGALSHSRLRDLDANRSHWSYRTLRRPRQTRHNADDTGEHSWQEEEETYDELHGYPDMTLLTDASFNFAHDKVLEAITDVEPWEPGWDELQSINLSRRRLESCMRLKEFLPALEEVDLQTNELCYLTGIPTSVRVLNVSHNRLTSMASFGHLLHLEELDISGNQIDSLTHLSCLKHLHTLKADGNAISSLDGIDKIRSLAHVSLSGNRLKGINLATTQWSGLETLDASHNQLISIRGLSLMRRLKSLNVDHNDLTMVDLSPVMPRLRVMRVSGNVRLQTLDVAPAKRLRTLYADYCDLDRIQNLDLLESLDNLSMRQQAEAAIMWPADQLRDVRRLFLSGNAFPQGISTTSAIKEARKPIAAPLSAQPSLGQPLRFLDLVYLELSACQLMQLPEDLAQVAPNLRSLNLDHNLISTLPNLEGMQRLKRLSLVGCRVKKSKSIITAVRGLSELQVLDCRTNPCTLGLYAPLIAPSATPTHRGEDDRSDMDALAASWLPPVPNAQIVQPDLAASERRREANVQREQIDLLEKSHFHKRQPPLADYAIDPNATLAKDALEKETARRAAKDGASYSSLFLAADARFVKTLPKQFHERRVLHRGLLAMACAKLTWIDGLLIQEEEIEEADTLVQSRRFDRAPVS